MFITIDAAVKVVIAALEVDEGRLTLDLVGKEQESSCGPAEMAPVATAS